MHRIYYSQVNVVLINTLTEIGVSERLVRKMRYEHMISCASFVNYVVTDKLEHWVRLGPLTLNFYYIIL
jgi:hypothetical protein